MSSPFKQKCHSDNIFDYTEHCRSDSFQCSQWWKFCQNDDMAVSVFWCHKWCCQWSMIMMTSGDCDCGSMWLSSMMMCAPLLPASTEELTVTLLATRMCTTEPGYSSWGNDIMSHEDLWPELRDYTWPVSYQLSLRGATVPGWGLCTPRHGPPTCHHLASCRG